MFDKKEPISSRQNPTVKLIYALLDKKARREAGLFRFDGIKLFCEAAECGLDIRYVVVADFAVWKYGEALQKEADRGRLLPSSVLVVTGAVFEKLSDERSPEGIITVAGFGSTPHAVLSSHAELCVGESERLLIAESMRDPGNLGTVVRSAAALGIDRLILSDDCADLYNPKTIRAAMGGLFRLRIDILPTSELPNAIRKLRNSGRRVFAAALSDGALPIGEIELRRRDCFVIGNEGHGLSRDAVEACDASAIIPMQKGCESLNAAAAATVCIWETVRAK